MTPMALAALCCPLFCTSDLAPASTYLKRPWRACSALSLHVAQANAGTGGPFKLAIVGDLQGVGRPLSLLLARSPFLSLIHLFDTLVEEAEIDNIVSELNQKEGNGIMAAGFRGIADLGTCLAGMDMVVILWGACGEDGRDLFIENAGMVKDLVQGFAQRCPKAWLLLMSSPLDAMLPMAANVLRSYRAFDPARVFGITKADMVVAAQLVGKMKDLDPDEIEVPVVGGHLPSTILPFLSKTNPRCLFSEDEIEELTEMIRQSKPDVELLAKSAAMFVESCLRARAGESDVFDFAFVQNAVTPLNYFSTRIKLCRSGVQYVIASDFIDMSRYEEAAHRALLPALKANIDRGLAFAPKDCVVAM